MPAPPGSTPSRGMTVKGTAPLSDPAHRRWLHEAVERYHRPLVGYAHSLLGDRERAKDVAQDTLMRLCRQPREKFERDIAPNLAPWLFTVCRRRAIDVLRKERKMNATDPQLIDQTTAASGVTTGGDASLAVEQRDTADALMALVASLPDAQREVVRLRFDSRLSYRQISEVTGHSVSYVGVLLHEAINTLRHRLTAMTS